MEFWQSKKVGTLIYNLYFILQVHSSDFPGNYVGYDDTWNHEEFKKVRRLCRHEYTGSRL